MIERKTKHSIMSKIMRVVDLSSLMKRRGLESPWILIDDRLFL